MPASGSSTKHYAQVVFQIAREESTVDKWQQDLTAIVNLATTREAAQVLKNPRFPMEARRRVLEATLSGASPQAINLATLLVSQGRLDSLAPSLATEFDKLVDESKGIIGAQVTTAVPVDADTEQGISDRLAKATGKVIRMQTKVEPAILGGMVVRLGDQIVDGSVRSNLNSLRRSLAEGEGIRP